MAKTQMELILSTLVQCASNPIEHKKKKKKKKKEEEGYLLYEKDTNLDVHIEVF